MYKLLILLVNFGKDKGERVKVERGKCQGFELRVSGFKLVTSFIKYLSTFYCQLNFAKCFGGIYLQNICQHLQRLSVITPPQNPRTILQRGSHFYPQPDEQFIFFQLLLCTYRQLFFCCSLIYFLQLQYCLQNL